MLDHTFWKNYFQTYDLLNKLIPYDDLLNTIMKDLDCKMGTRVLDAGSGTGNLAVRLESRGMRVTGLELSEAGIALHKSKLPHAEIVRGDITMPLPFVANSFDALYSNNVLYTIEPRHRPAIFLEFYRVLKPGGTIVISNLVQGFRPLAIYMSHIRSDVHIRGIRKTAQDLCSFIIPTLKLFYYNYLIKKAHHGAAIAFMRPREQEELLVNSGFTFLKTVSVYAAQAELVVGIKK